MPEDTNEVPAPDQAADDKHRMIDHVRESLTLMHDFLDLAETKGPNYSAGERDIEELKTLAGGDILKAMHNLQDLALIVRELGSAYLLIGLSSGDVQVLDMPGMTVVDLDGPEIDKSKLN